MCGHPRENENCDGDHGGDLGDKDHRLFLNLSDGLKERDDETDDEADEQQGGRDQQSQQKRLANQVACLIDIHVPRTLPRVALACIFDAYFIREAAPKKLFNNYVTKLPIRLPVIKCQPSTRTKSNNLNGNEINTGGSIIMPMLMRMAEMTMSTIKNGK